MTVKFDEEGRGAEKSLRLAGLKVTKARVLLFNIMGARDIPVSAEELYGGILKEGGEINLSTVYRTLEVFYEKGICERQRIGAEGGTVYELSRDTHRHYLVCTDCKKLVPIDGCPLEEYEKKLEKKSGFSISNHKLILYGICPKCREKSN